MGSGTFGVIQCELEIEIRAPRTRAWNALAHEVTAWWPNTFVCGTHVERFVLEPVLGGRMYEDWGGGSGIVWFTVIGLEEGKSLDLAGHLTRAFGGPATTQLRLAVEERGAGTVLSVHDVRIGRIAPGIEREVEAGWRELFEQSFKSYVERAPTRPVPPRKRVSKARSAPKHA
jgi:hypothetical protein